MITFGLWGCGLSRNPVPIALMPEAEPLEFPGVRSWAKQYSKVFQEDIIESAKQESPEDFPVNPDGSRDYSILALSGGGANGAFGAGFLCGWTQEGTRPKFKLVTGISTGALIAPYAFLGPDYDQQLQEAYTTISTKDIMIKKGLFASLFGESFSETSPMVRMIEKQFDEKIMDAIAQQHCRGHRLYVGTTNLDAGRFVVWNMGAIAASGHHNAIQFFRKILLASASIPGAFPPVYFDVEADGLIYDEMHVDGGVTTEVFLYGFMLDIDAAARQTARKVEVDKRGSVYIIRNGKIDATPKQIQRKLPQIIQRSLSVLTRSHTWGDLYRIYVISQRDRIDFNYACIADDYVPQAKEPFDPEEMKRLFEMGFQKASRGYRWRKLPPGLSYTFQNQKNISGASTYQLSK